MMQPNRPNEPPPLMGRFGPGNRQFGKVERAKDTRATLLRMWQLLRERQGMLIIVALLVILTTILQVIGPYLLGIAIDQYILRGDLPGLAQIALLMLVVYLLTSLLSWVQSYLMAGVAQRTVRDLRDRLFGHVQVLPLRSFDQRPHGELISRLTNDVENINLVLADGLIQLISGVLGLIGVTIAMLLINPTLTVISVGVIAFLTIGLNRGVAPRTRGGFRQQQAALGELNGLIEETITGQRVVIAYRRQPQIMEQFEQINQRLRHAAVRAQFFAGIIGPMMNWINNLGLLVVGGVGGWMAAQGLATVGVIAGFIGYSRQFGRPLNELATIYNAIQAGIAGAERVFALLDEPAEIDAKAVATATPTTLKGDVRFNDVDFAYLPDQPVLRQVSLHAQPGQIVALVGPTGAGKTTIINLLTRFYEIDQGLVTIDGHDLRSFAKADLRRQLGIVLQDTFLFAGTVMENIRYGRLEASDEQVIAAAKLANADQFIHRLPHGYQTMLSERGNNLSQGQRQLLAIARAMLADPRILILDEATSSVDTRTEVHIQEAMLRLMQGRTSFVIAHRLSTIRDADQILVIDGGRIVERGTHTQLLNQPGMYQRLYQSQFKG
ncbi:MAG: ABC transporter ATP-binding protein [Roseiflexaceae bacterium]